MLNRHGNLLGIPKGWQVVDGDSTLGNRLHRVVGNVPNCVGNDNDIGFYSWDEDLHPEPKEWRKEARGYLDMIEMTDEPLRSAEDIKEMNLWDDLSKEAK